MIMILLNIYFVSTLFISSYYFYDLYSKENTCYLFLLHLTKSSFYHCLFINLILMIFLLIGLIIIYILFGKITKSELKKIGNKIISNKYIRVANMVDLRLITKLDIMEKYLAIQFLGFYMIILTDILYQRGTILCLNYEKNKLKQFKIIVIYIILIYLNYLSYAFIFPVENLEIDPLNKSMISYSVNYDFFHCFIKLQEGFYKSMINITSINMNKLWNKKIFVFDIISIAKYLLYLSYDLKAIYIFTKIEDYNLNFLVSGSNNFLKLTSLLYSLYSKYLHLKFIQSLTNYDINTDLLIQGEISKKIGEEEISIIRKNNINVCIICLGEVEKGKYLNCGHIFHINCLEEWILQYKKCPICNSPINIYSNEKSEFYNKRLRIKAIDNNNITNDNNNRKDNYEALAKDDDINPANPNQNLN